jgi:hypothetical protein
MPAGRNEPCPCGSGRKYKQCHGASAHVIPPEDLEWRQTRRAVDGLPALLLRFVNEVYGSDAIHEAWNEFLLWPHASESDDDEEWWEPFDAASPHIPLFMPWFFHQWAPDPHGTCVIDEALHDRSPSREFLERRGARIDPVLRRYLEGCVEAPFSFHEIIRCEPGRGFRSRDLFTHEEHEVLEQGATRSLQQGDTIYAQLVVTGGITLLEACGLRAIPPERRLPLVQQRTRMARRSAVITRDDVRDWEIELRELYLRLDEALANPLPPQLRNTDDEVLAPQQLIFEIESAADAFALLRDLAIGCTEAELLEGATFDADGVLRTASFHWAAPGNRIHSSWQSTVLGHISIADGKLKVDVNSDERAARIRAIIEARLGKQARYRATRIDNIEAAIAAARESPGTAAAGREPSPEIAAAISELTAAHFDEWVTVQVPALGGRTPLEAVRDPEGRELVRALVDGMERAARRRRPPTDPALIRRLRQRLGLL